MKSARNSQEIEAENARLRADVLALQEQLQTAVLEKKKSEEEKEKAEQKSQRLETDKQHLELSKQHLEIDKAVLEDENKRLRGLLYGQKRERFVASTDPKQLTLALGLESAPEPEAEKEKVSYERKKPRQKRKHKPSGRKPWPADLKRVTKVILPEGDLEGMKKIGTEVTEILDFVPAKPFVWKFERPIYASKTPDPETQKTRVVCAELPSIFIPKLSVGPGMLAAIACDKFLDHLPLYRQHIRFKRLGVKIARSTMDNWLRLLAQWLEPLGEALKKEVFSADYLQADETTIRVLDKSHNLPKTGKKKPPGKTHRGYFWSYFAPVEKLCWFEYCPGRGKEYPQNALEAFTGSVQTDGYAAYDQFAESKTITLVGCLAHVRRKFFEAKNNDPRRAQQALGLIQKLYAIEREAREAALDFEQRLKLRTEKAQDAWKEFSEFLEKSYPQVLPQSAIGKAIAYAIKRSPFIEQYLYDGKLEIDNNLVENQIRPIALGRKNYLFAGSEKGAQRAALFYALLASCKLNDVDPFTWLHDVLQTLPEYPISQIDQLLPSRWNREQPNPELWPQLQETEESIEKY
jgi:transposase